MQCTADPVSVRAQQTAPKTVKEAVLGTVTCSNPEILCRAMQRFIPETDSLNAPCEYMQPRTPSPAAARFCLARLRNKSTLKRGLVAQLKSL